MEKINVIISIIAAIAAVVSAVLSYNTLRYSKRNILKKLDKKQQQLSDINIEIAKRYGLNYSPRGPINSLETKKRELQSEIENIQKML